MEGKSSELPPTPLAQILAFAERRVPAAWASRVAQVRRDVAVIEARVLHGQHPSPLVDRRRGRTEERPSLRVAPAPEPIAPAVGAPVAPSAPVAAPAADLVTVTLVDGDATYTFRPADDEFVLQAALGAGANVPFSCTLGGCGTCKVRLVEGEYGMEEPNCLTPDEIEDGYVLTCVGRAKSSCTLRLEREE